MWSRVVGAEGMDYRTTGLGLDSVWCRVCKDGGSMVAG